MNDVVEAPINTEVDGSVMRTYMIALSMHIGNLTSLFNQYYVLLSGIVNEEKVTGFASLIKDVEIKEDK